MTKQSKEALIRRIKTEIAFIYSDRAHGGPARAEEMADWKRQEAEALQIVVDDDPVDSRP